MCRRHFEYTQLELICRSPSCSHLLLQASPSLLLLAELHCSSNYCRWWRQASVFSKCEGVGHAAGTFFNIILILHCWIRYKKRTYLKDFVFLMWVLSLLHCRISFRASFTSCIFLCAPSGLLRVSSHSSASLLLDLYVS